MIVLNIFFLAATLKAATAADWNSLLGAKNIFPLEINSVASNSGHADSITAELTQLLSQPAVLSHVYHNYLVNYQKLGQRSSNNDDLNRQNIFKEKLIRIAKHNVEAASGKWTWTKGVNQFSDMTAAEFTATYGGALTPSTFLAAFEPALNFTQLSQSTAKNWKDEGIVTEVKNQGSCGSCYAFASIAVAESVNAQKTGKLVEYSEQEIVDCTNGRNRGCNSGNSPNSWDYMKSNGISLRSDYPYTSGRGKVGSCSSKGKQHYAKIRSYQRISGSEDNIAAGVNKYPLSVIINSNEWQDYQSGVFSACGRKLDGSNNHIVALVGFDADTWLMKNSWGKGWGEEGYIRMKRGCNSADIQAWVYAITAMA